MMATAALETTSVHSEFAVRFVFPPSKEAARKKPPLSRGFSEEAHTGFEPVPPP